MASYVFSANPNVVFDPTKDVLVVDNASAASLRIQQVGSNVVLTNGTNTATLQNVVIQQLTGPGGKQADNVTLYTNISFTDGSVLLVGDNTVGIGGDAAANAFAGTGKADQLRGFDGADAIATGGGNDLVYGNQGNDAITITTSAATDRVKVYGGQGDDAVAFDAVNATNGNILVYGNLGNDNLTGGSGNDAFYGGQGNDQIQAGTGSNLVYGNLGNDTITGADGSKDKVYGGQGDDNIQYGALTTSAALIYGNLGNDILVGGAKADTIYGGQGVDDFTGGVGADVLTGGLGSDTFRYANTGADSGVATATADVIRDFVTGTDKITLGGGALVGTNGNYREFSSTTATTVETAVAAYEAASNPASTYTFVAGPTDGYLVFDKDLDSKADSVIQLSGLSDVSKFDFTDIV